MFRPAARALLRAPVAFRPAQSRLASTSAAEQPKSRSWKNTALRLGLAFGAVYYYNTSSVFTEHSFLLPKNTQPSSSESTSEPTLDSIKPRIRNDPNYQSQSKPETQGEQGEGEEEPQEAAFNPETGEINWDCPCLGGMAHGPCGEEFKAAFSCFVYSTDEPKGMDCIDKFKGMQDCFRAHPDVYGAELDDEDDDANATAAAPSPGDESKPESQDHAQSGTSASAAVPATQLDASSHPAEKHSRAKEVRSQIKENPNAQVEQSESEELLPKAWHDTEEKNATKAAATEK